MSSTEPTHAEIAIGSDALNRVSNGGLYDPMVLSGTVLAAVLPLYRDRLLKPLLDFCANADEYGDEITTADVRSKVGEVK